MRNFYATPDRLTTRRSIVEMDRDPISKDKPPHLRADLHEFDGLDSTGPEDTGVPGLDSPYDPG
jgi:hypothetical protein